MAGETTARLDSMAAPKNAAFFEEENKNDGETSNTEKRKLARSTAFGHVFVEAFRDILDRIRSRPKSRIIYDESSVYCRLMEDLGDEKEPPSWSNKLFFLLSMVVILGLMVDLVATRRVKRIRHHRHTLTLRGWRWVVVVYGPLAVQIVNVLVLQLVKWRWRTHKYVVYFVEEIKLCVDVTLWFGVGLVTWCLWFKPSLMKAKGDVSNIVAYHITRVLIALVVGSFLWLLKNLLYLKLKADLHYDHLFPKIRRTVIDFHCLQIIYNDGKWKFLDSEKKKRKVAMEMKTKMNEGHVEGKNIWMDVDLMEKQTAPIWITRQLAHNYLKKLLRLPKFSAATKDGQKLLKEAQKLLRRVTRGDERSDILLDDLRKYKLDKEEQDFLFEIFYEDEEKEERMEERPEAKTITKEQFLSWAVVAYNNCWGLQRTLLSSERIFVKLSRIMNTFLLTVVLIIWLLLSKIVDTAQLALLFMPLLVASFIFEDNCKKMFDGLIFAFIVRPFDVGDRVVVDNVHMKVSEVNILTSVFLIECDTGEEEAVFQNSLLAGTTIVNLGNIPDQADSIEFSIPSSTPSEDITDLELKIKMASDDDLPYSSQTKVAKDFGKEEIKMAVCFKYLFHYLKAEKKARYRSSILTKIMEFNEEMETNIQRWSSSMNDRHQVILPVEFTLDPKVTLRQINDLKEKILEAYGEQYIKLILKGLHKKKIEMLLYLRHPKCSPGDSMDAEKRGLQEEIQTLKDQLKIPLKDQLKIRHQSTGSPPSRRLSEVRQRTSKMKTP